MQATQEQQAVVDLFEEQFGPLDTSTKRAILVEAVAGSGKTSVLMLVADALERIMMKSGQTRKSVVVSFNTHIKKELEKRLRKAKSSMSAKTTNGLGLSILSAIGQSGAGPVPSAPDEDKYFRLSSAALKKRGYKNPSAKLAAQVNKLADFARLTYVEPTEENLIEIVTHYDLESVEMFAESWPVVWSSVASVIRAGVEEYKTLGKIDFTDQIYIPLALSLSAPIYDVILTDECQDLNNVRLQLVKSALAPGGQAIFVGDDWQAMQGFAGADTDSMKTIREETNAIALPLTCCFRCDSAIIEVAQQIVSHIRARDNAPRGIVAEIKQEQMYDMLHEGETKKEGRSTVVTKDPDLILCRTGKELVLGCLACIRLGKRAVVRGKEMGRSLTAIVDACAKIIHCPIDDMPFEALTPALEAYYTAQLDIFHKLKNSATKVAELDDKLATVDALLEAYLDDAPLNDRSMSAFKSFILDKFSDTNQTAIMFSTIHKSKGLEYDRVFIIRPDLLPFPAAKLAWQVKQEWNILYVAITRARHELYFVDGIPANPEGGLLTLPVLEQRPQLLLLPAPDNDEDEESDDEEQEETTISAPAPAMDELALRRQERAVAREEELRAQVMDHGAAAHYRRVEYRDPSTTEDGDESRARLAFGPGKSAWKAFTEGAGLPHLVAVFNVLKRAVPRPKDGALFEMVHVEETHEDLDDDEEQEEKGKGGRPKGYSPKDDDDKRTAYLQVGMTKRHKAAFIKTLEQRNATSEQQMSAADFIEQLLLTLPDYKALYESMSAVEVEETLIPRGGMRNKKKS